MTTPKDQLLDLVLHVHSKEQRNKVIAWVGDDRKRFDLLMSLFLGSEPVIVQRLAWTLRFIGDNHLDWMNEYIDPIIKAIQNPIHDAVVRNGLLVLVDLDIPKKHWGGLLELGFGYLTKVGTPTAIKRAALLVVDKICEFEPELKEELILVLQDQIPHSTVGFKGIAKKTIRKWQT